jgi:anti-sigma regulatory factor (Ser/Thr protein kinase)
MSTHAATRNATKRRGRKGAGTPGGEITFSIDTLAAMRRSIAVRAQAAGLDFMRVADLVLAVNELATNSILHGGGTGGVRMWTDGEAVLCEVRDSGRFERPAIVADAPRPSQTGGRGLWIVDRVCDAVSIDAQPAGTSIQVRMDLPVH